MYHFLLFIHIYLSYKKNLYLNIQIIFLYQIILLLLFLILLVISLLLILIFLINKNEEQRFSIKFEIQNFSNNF